MKDIIKSIEDAQSNSEEVSDFLSCPRDFYVLSVCSFLLPLTKDKLQPFS